MKNKTGIPAKSIALSAIISVIILLLFYYFIDFRQFFSLIKDINIMFIVLAIFCQVIVYYVRAKRFQFILNIHQLKKLYSISTIHFFLNKILPARLGEFSLPVFFNKFSSISYKKGIGALLFFRFLDLLSIIGLFSLSLFFINIQEMNKYILVLTAVILLLILILLWLKLDLAIAMMEKLIDKIKFRAITRFKSKILETFDQIIQYKKNKPYRFWWKILLFSLFNWLLTYCFFYSIIIAFNLEYNFIEVVFAATLSNFTLILPLSTLGGIGTFEIGWVAGFMILGMSREIALPIGLFTNLFATILTGIMALLGYIYLILTNANAELN